MEVKVIILDFDGVILESENVKDSAFEILFKDYPDHLDEVLTYHRNHSGTVRFEKFRHIYENILGQSYTDKIKKQLSTRFSEIVTTKAIESEFVPGGREFLEFFYGKVPLYLASVNPAPDLKLILDKRDLRKFFKAVYAHPTSKKDALTEILNKEGVAHTEAVFIGDSPQDYLAAQAKNIYFIGRDGGKSFDGADIPVCSDLKEIKELLMTDAIEEVQTI